MESLLLYLCFLLILLFNFYNKLVLLLFDLFREIREISVLLCILLFYLLKLCPCSGQFLFFEEELFLFELELLEALSVLKLVIQLAQVRFCLNTLVRAFGCSFWISIAG